jgi:hypothetical protein
MEEQTSTIAHVQTQTHTLQVTPIHIINLLMSALLFSSHHHIATQHVVTLFIFQTVTSFCFIYSHVHDHERCCHAYAAADV